MTINNYKHNIILFILLIICLMNPSHAVEVIKANFIMYDKYEKNIKVSIFNDIFGDEIDLNMDVGRFLMQNNSISNSISPLGSNLNNYFFAFCLEPQQFLANSAEYELVSISDAGNSLNGIGLSAELRIRELFGRFAPFGGYSYKMSNVHAAAFQIAIWEIVSDRGRPLSLTDGAFSMSRESNVELFEFAQSWIEVIDGTGPLASGIMALRNGSTENIFDGSQDLLIFTQSSEPIPEPSTWSMLVIGFFICGFFVRSKNRYITS